MTTEDTAAARRGPREEPQERRPRKRGEERDKLRTELVKKYALGESIRSLAAEYGLSFGLTRNILVEGDVQFRGRTRQVKAVAK